MLGDDGELAAPPHVLRARLDQLRAEWPGPVIVGLASSRTLREITVLQRALALPGPCIAEDGAKYAVDETTAGEFSAPAALIEQHGRRRLHVRALARSADELRHMTNDTPALNRADTRAQSRAALRALGFGSNGSIRRALESRTHSVLLDPHVWTQHDLEHVRAITDARGLQLRRGGRWFTLTTAGGKGPGVRALRHHFGAHGVSPVVAAIGNEENDRALLAEADCRFVIRNPHRGPHPMLSSLPGAIVLDTVGPGGWMEMLDRLLPCAVRYRANSRDVSLPRHD